MTMLIYHGLRLAGDIGFYVAYAGFFAACFGGGQLLPGLALAAVGYGASYRMRDWGRLRLLAAVPVLLWLCWPGLAWADRILFVPAAAYCVYQMEKGEYILSQYHEADVFWMLCRSYPIFAVAAAGIWNKDAVFSVSMPLACMTAVLCVALMRALRHDPEVYGQRGFLLRSAAPMALIAGGAGLLSWRSFLSGMGWLYLHTLYPVLLGAASVVSGVLAWMFPALQWLADLFADHRQSQTIEQLYAQGAGQPAEPKEPTTPLDPRILMTVGAAVLCVGVVVLLVWLFRRMTRTGPRPEGAEGFALPFVRREIEMPAAGDKPAEKRSAAEKVRRQYRKYLRLCVEQGMSLRPADTSREVLQNVGRPGGAEEELRSLYLKARYAGEAEKADAARAKELVKQIREEKKGG